MFDFKQFAKLYCDVNSLRGLRPSFHAAICTIFSLWDLESGKNEVMAQLRKRAPLARGEVQSGEERPAGDAWEKYRGLSGPTFPFTIMHSLP